MRKYLSIIGLIIVTVCIIASCGGSGNSNEDPADGNSAQVYLTVNNLSGDMKVKLNSNEELLIKEDGEYKLPGVCNPGENYTVTIVDSPPLQNYVFDATNGSSGTLLEGRNASVVNLTEKTRTYPLNGKKIYLAPTLSSNVVYGGTETFAFLAGDIVSTIEKRLIKSGAGVLRSTNGIAGIAEANIWGADIAVGVCINAGGGHGTESFYKTGSPASQNLASHLRDQMVLVGRNWYTSWPERSIKTNDSQSFYTTAVMPSSIVWIAFGDCTLTTTCNESGHLRNRFFRNDAAKGLIKAIFANYSITYAQPDAPLNIKLNQIEGINTIDWDPADDASSQDTSNVFYLIYLKKDNVLLNTTPVSIKSSVYSLPELDSGSYTLTVSTLHTIYGEGPESESVSFSVP
jgi:hypothetical protein